MTPPPKDGDGIDGEYAALITAETQGLQVTDDRTESDAHGYRHFLVTPDQERKLLNVVEVVDQLEKFSDTDKAALAIVISDHAELHAVADGRRLRRMVGKRLKWLLVQIGALLAAVVALNDIISNYLKFRGVK